MWRDRDAEAGDRDGEMGDRDAAKSVIAMRRNERSRSGEVRTLDSYRVVTMRIRAQSSAAR
jgi:hypothetical protein